MPLVPFDAPVPEWSPGGSYGHLRYGPGHETLTGPGRARSTFGLRDGLLTPVGRSRKTAGTVFRCAQDLGLITGPQPLARWTLPFTTEGNLRVRSL
jgi:hypothetical protein